MAKSARASSKKNNRAILRRDVFQPTNEQRTQRLHERLMATIVAAQDGKAEMDVEKVAGDEAGPEIADTTAMEVDNGAGSERGGSGKSTLKSRGRIAKRRNQKPRNAIRFAPKTGAKRKGRK